MNILIKILKNPFELYEPDADDSIIDTNISNTSEQDKETIEILKNGQTC